MGPGSRLHCTGPPLGTLLFEEPKGVKTWDLGLPLCCSGSGRGTLWATHYRICQLNVRPGQVLRQQEPSFLSLPPFLPSLTQSLFSRSLSSSLPLSSSLLPFFPSRSCHIHSSFEYLLCTQSVFFFFVYPWLSWNSLGRQGLALPKGLWD